MQTCTKELTKEQWEECTYVDQIGRRHIRHDKEDKVFSDAVIWGYGLYGTSCYEQDGKYICEYNIGNSCD